MLFKVTYRKILPWIFLLIFIIPMIIGGIVLIWGFFNRETLEPGYRSIKEAMPALVGGIISISVSLIILISHFLSKKDSLEVYSNYFILKQKGRPDWTIYVKDVALEYTDDGGYINHYSIHQYYLKYNNRVIQVFTNQFKNINKLCDFCIENHVPEISPASWEKCKKHLHRSLIS